MKDKLKKYLLPNLPYLFFVYLFDKLCQAVRLAPGLDVSEKLLHIGQGFQTAFASSAPSFHVLDICVGIFGAILVRLAVYLKAKNAKKYRRGVEYGSARWGRPEDIAPYIDPVPDWNIPLTRTESLTMTSRPKDPKTARNKNILVIGGSGSGKTRFFVKPSIMQMHSSYVITDPKGQLLDIEGGEAGAAAHQNALESFSRRHFEFDILLDGEVLRLLFCQIVKEDIHGTFISLVILSGFAGVQQVQKRDEVPFLRFRLIPDVTDQGAV